MKKYYLENYKYEIARMFWMRSDESKEYSHLMHTVSKWNQTALAGGTLSMVIGIAGLITGKKRGAVARRNDQVNEKSNAA